MKWGFSGTRRGREDTIALANELLETRGRPDEIVVGCAAGVDKQIRLWAKFHDITLNVKTADKSVASPKRFHDRNQEIADELVPEGDVLFALPDDSSRGTYDCIKRCKARGIEVVIL
ncbi:MAG: hypothetical protein JWO15_3617 [Sphingomonadales bacterium]|nr:hypothetical protein [Sphingomonadales bacterium]